MHIDKTPATLIAAAVFAALTSFAKPYTRLFRIINPQGSCTIMRPGATEFEPVQRDKAYPFGSVVSCGKDSSSVLLFSDADAVRLLADSSARIEVADNAGQSRIVSLQYGTVLTRINATTTNDFVMIDTPAGRARSIIGNCRVTLSTAPATKTEPETVNVELRAEPSSRMKFIGHQYIIPILKNGFGARISSYPDDSYTYIYDLLGDYSIYVNTGVDADPPEPFDDNGNLNPVKLSTKAALRVWRERAAVGNTLVVAVLATTPAGKGRESFAFAVGKADIAARSNVFLDTITNELAMAEMAKASGTSSDDPFADDAFGAFPGGGDDFPGDAGGDLSGGAGDDAGGAPAADSQQSGDESLYEFLF